VLRFSEDARLLSVMKTSMYLFLMLKHCKINSVNAFHRCLTTCAEVGGILSKSSKPHRMRHPSSCLHHPPMSVEQMFFMQTQAVQAIR
jgi:hypothetical protein